MSPIQHWGKKRVHDLATGGFYYSLPPLFRRSTRILFRHPFGRDQSPLRMPRDSRIELLSLRSGD